MCEEKSPGAIVLAAVEGEGDAIDLRGQFMILTSA
ncbi:hypothetical protein FB466_0735 [Klugiella xanthotipulae]|uniref:Uncharacterized protein n=1 Tax=Klugiella xanthotipulae TaxID=244735 RepID=A0A543I5P7_9MICO|nr:hypothetical protein FB466_0735 [Klugiella xanthotipulae]